MPMTDPNASPAVAELDRVAQTLRAASFAGLIMPIDEVWPGSAEEFFALLSAGAPEAQAAQATAVVPDAPASSPQSPAPDRGAYADLALVWAGDQAFVYSNRHMTRQYAEAAARSATGDLEGLIAEAVREDSATYPRPTPVAVFSGPPFQLSAERVTAVVAGMFEQPRYADIRAVRASDGSGFLYSADHLTAPLAESLAEWMAVRQFDNP
jgi:hypothetical protein